MKLTLLLCAGVLGVHSPEQDTPAAPDRAPAVELTYLGNEGFLVAAGESKVLVDALYGAGLAGYAVVPREIRARAEGAQGAFAGVDFVLASHFHGDHFDPAAVARHLAGNRRARFVGPKQAANQLRELAGEDEQLRKRVTGLYPAEGASTDLEHAGISLKLLNLHHGRDRDPPVQNLGFVFDVGGVRFLHMGDTEVVPADLLDYDFHAMQIDVALVPAWYFVFDKWRPVIDVLEAKHIVAMHLRTAKFGGGDEEDRRSVIQRAHPDVWIPGTALEKRSFEPAQAQ